MLRPDRIPLNQAEHDAVDTLTAKHSGQPVSITRRDPGDAGPLLVHVGDATTYLVDESGRARKQQKRKS